MPFVLLLSLLAAEPDYVAPMKKLLAESKGRPGVVIHVGDSITYANPYGQWARFGKGQSAADKAILQWMHAGKGDDTDGWFLAAVDRPGGRSETAAGGLRADQLLAGDKNRLPSLADLISKYRPQMVVLMIGTNDASAGRGVKAYRADLDKCVDTILAAKAICLLTTIPPHVARPDLSKDYNAAVREIAAAKKIPLIDYEAEILRRRPTDWNGTLLNENDVHPTAGQGKVGPSSEPTEENLRQSGYLLRGWLTVQKIAEVKRLVFDGQP